MLAHAEKEIEKFGELGHLDEVMGGGGDDVDILLSTCRRDQ